MGRRRVMNDKELRKQHKELWSLWVQHKFKYPDTETGPIPQKGKNYIIAIVNDQSRCFVVIEYNDGWTGDINDKGKAINKNIPSKEIISFNGNENQGKAISENEFISLLIDIIKIYSTEDLQNQLHICIRTNGSGQIAFDAIRMETVNMLSLENIQIFPTTRRSKYGKELFTKLGQGWDMTSAVEKDCFDAMKTAQEEGFFSLGTNKSIQMFQLTSLEEIQEKGIEPFMYCWFMLSFIRLSKMSLFRD